MAKRIYQAKDKLVQRRVRGAMVVENVRTKKRRCPARIFNSTRAVPSGQTLSEAEFPCRIGKKDVELDLNMARGPDGRIDPLDTLEDASINSENPKGRRRDKKRYDRVTGKRETVPAGDTASRKSIRRRFESEKSIRAEGENTFSESDGPRRSEQFKYRSDDLRDRTFRGTAVQTTGESMESAKKRTQRRNASRLRFDEEELRLNAEAAYPETHDANDEDNAYVTENGYKPRHLKRSSTEEKTVRSGENEKSVDGDEEEFVEGMNDFTDAEASAASEVKQRRRNQASAFRAEKAKEAASAETVEELAEGETARVENLSARKRKTRLNFSDEETGFVHGAGSLAKRTAKTAVTPAMLYANQQLHEASAENTGVQSVEAGGLAVRRTTSLAKSSKRAANRRSASKARMETVKQEHAAQVEHRKKEQIRAFQKKKRQRAAIAAKRKQSVVSAGGFVDSADTVFSIPEKAKKAAQSFFSEHKGAIIGVAVAGLLFALVGVSMTSVASLVHGSGTTVISTTYVSTDEDIYAAENAYCALEDGLNAQINDLQNTHPGFDDYEYQIDPIDHNPYQLISYLQVKFGGFVYDDEVRDEIQRLFRQQYTISLSEGSEIRTRTETVMETREVYDEETGLTVIEEYPVEQEVEYEHWTQYTVLTNYDFDSVARANMTAEETILYEALNETFGNRPYLFDLSAASGVAGSGIQFDYPPEALSDEKFVNMIREAEKYLGRPYVWGGKNPRDGFDCSGFVCWVLNHCGNGWNVGQKRAKELCRMCTYVSPEQARPGDLIFFEKTYDTDGASHVGIYVGQNTMIHCGHPIKYGRIDTRYFKAHFLCFGRLPFYDN